MGEIMEKDINSIAVAIFAIIALIVLLVVVLTTPSRAAVVQPESGATVTVHLEIAPMGTKHMAADEARDFGWSKTRAPGWVCPKCTQGRRGGA
jgi:hypothetical protein